jgi:S1-C subfamily serine protease
MNAPRRAVVSGGFDGIRAKEGSPALALGFENFSMDQFGVTGARLRRLARTPELPVPGHPREEKSDRDSRVATWLGARVRNIIGLGEVSAAGLPGETGVSLLEVPGDSAAAKAGLEAGDVILKCAGCATHQMADLERSWRAASPGPVALQVWRGLSALPVTVTKE